MVQAIAKELILRKNELKNKLIETIYFGGGTPSLLTISELQFLMDTVYQNYKVVSNPEITLEANPDDLNQNYLSFRAESRNLYQEYQKIGINRLSIGIQSFFEADLKAMNRAHTAKESELCLQYATEYFDNITIDLIYGIPNMSNSQWLENLNKAFRFNVPHISSYALTVEPKTALHAFIKKGNYPAINDSLALQHFKTLQSETQKQGFIQYEVSNFSKENYFSKHNTSYWQGHKYLGVGPAAHSYNGITRSWNCANNIKYLKAIADNILPQEIENLSTNDRFNETVMTGLRTIWGVSLDKIEQEFGMTYKTQLLKTSEKYIAQGLLHKDKEKLKTTSKGLFLADGIAADLFVI